MHPRVRRHITPLLDAFTASSCLTRAAALSFTSILSLIPFLAFAFAILKGFDVPNRIEPLLLDNVAAGSEELVERIISYINNTNMKSLGTAGLVTLLFTVVSLIGEIEGAFNAIWGVRETRSLGRKFTDYISMVVVGPILLTAATSISTTLQSQEAVTILLENSYAGPLLLTIFRIIPFVSIGGALTFAYFYLPNTRVALSSALVGGTVAGTAWQLAQWGYLYLQIYMTSYNAIYGTMAVLPIFMIWVYTSWVIVLAGMLIVRRHQQGFWVPPSPETISPARREETILSILASVVERFRRPDLPPPDISTIAAQIPRIPSPLLEEGVETLVSLGLLTRSDTTPPRFLLAHDPALTTIGELLERLHRYPETEGGKPLTELPPLQRTTLDGSISEKTLAELPLLRLSS